ncbi:MAG: bifunctional diaminohydroxyphosphoribosylaminopyrimidine deaminase/5-amino-6-(5-phosphoribosylamino)uracil reductase RibD [Nitrospirae bacterium]|nr:bifunctional diaminohydroxyphosphoribosylaminopyrimidine deaminase/5-amino-6-(5-phosphoribosylamino)uracil reductase RibD [Nitrospirota bacterium]
MKKALALAAKGTGMTSPNPMVGAVIVRGNKIIAADYHRKAGMPHAEILALKKAGTRARGATLFITLEPCCHTDKRTPPCTKSIINSEIKKVVVAMKDPNPKVNGRGIKELANAGIKTEYGIMEKEAKKLNEAFIKFITKKEPFVILKIAQSIDGKIATSKGRSKWITGENSRRYVHKLRSSVDAVLTGIGTVLKDNPSLTSRIRGGKNPYRVIVDTSLRIPLNAKVIKHKDLKTIIAAIPPHPCLPDRQAPLSKGGIKGRYQKKVDILKNLGAQVLIVKAKNGKVDLKALMKELGKLNIMSLMIEGGSSINASALSDKVVDKVMFFIAPKIMGGSDSISSVGGKSPALLKNAFRIKNLQIKKMGEDLLLEGSL